MKAAAFDELSCRAGLSLGVIPVSPPVPVGPGPADVLVCREWLTASRGGEEERRMWIDERHCISAVPFEVDLLLLPPSMSSATQASLPTPHTHTYQPLQRQEGEWGGGGVEPSTKGRLIETGSPLGSSVVAADTQGSCCLMCHNPAGEDTTIFFSPLAER